MFKTRARRVFFGYFSDLFFKADFIEKERFTPFFIERNGFFSVRADLFTPPLLGGNVENL